MNKIYNPKRVDWNNVLKRPTQTVADIEGLVNGIFEEVRSNGDDTIKKYTEQFDKVVLENMLVSKTEIEEAQKLVSDDLKEAIKLAKANIEVFHKAQKTERIEVETAAGVSCWQEKRPIQKVGLYIPG
ncbi:MAG TPA: histidinol dehydrogenase, partial [Maribacter sp.]|nr:histidinol dehydrogenase [Maribacter sp.]